MNHLNILNRFLDNKTQYFATVSEFCNKYNLVDNLFLNIFHCNIRSISCHFDEFLLFLQNNCISCINLDIICLTETWHDINYCNFLIPGYQSYYSKIKRNQNDGIIIYVKYGLNVNFFEYEYIDANIIKVTLKTDKLSLSLLCIYSSPSGNKHDFLTILNNLIITLNSSNEKIIIIGDVNLNIIGVDNVNNEYLDIMSENEF